MLKVRIIKNMSPAKTISQMDKISEWKRSTSLCSDVCLRVSQIESVSQDQYSQMCGGLNYKLLIGMRSKEETQSVSHIFLILHICPAV